METTQRRRSLCVPGRLSNVSPSGEPGPWATTLYPVAGAGSSARKNRSAVRTGIVEPSRERSETELTFSAT